MGWKLAIKRDWRSANSESILASAGVVHSHGPAEYGASMPNPRRRIFLTSTAVGLVILVVGILLPVLWTDRYPVRIFSAGRGGEARLKRHFWRSPQGKALLMTTRGHASRPWAVSASTIRRRPSDHWASGTRTNPRRT